MVSKPDNSSLYKSAAGYQKVMSHYDTAFREMGISHETRYVETRFGPTHAVVSGNELGKSVALWHGLNANSTMWTTLIASLPPTYRVYAIDTIGGMGKSAPCRPPKSGPAYGLWAADTLKGLGLKQANMIGISNGGWLITKLAGVAPEMIGSAVLMSTGGFRPISKTLMLRMMPHLAVKSPAEAARRFLALLSPPGTPADPDTLEIFELIMRHFRFEHNPPVLRDVEIKQLTAPTCLMMGQHEKSFNPYKVIERGLGLLPNAITAEIVPGVGHGMIHERPDQVTGSVISFLE